MHPWVSARHNFVIKASDRSKDPVCLLAWSGTWHWGLGGKGGGGGEASHTLRLVDLSASEHKDSSVLGLEVSVSYLVSPTHDALESRFTYPHLPVPLLRPSTSIWFSLLGWIWEKLLFSLRPPPAETKAKRQSSLYGRHTNTTQENPPIWGNTHRNTHTNKIKQVRA